MHRKHPMEKSAAFIIQQPSSILNLSDMSMMMMGTKASAPVTSLTKEAVAMAVASHDAKYEAYANAVQDNGLDGKILVSLKSEEDLIEIFDELQITSKLHRKVLLKSLEKAKQNKSVAKPFHIELQLPQQDGKFYCCVVALLLHLMFLLQDSNQWFN